jgi:F-type H+-transporting ATPase subunit a
LLYPYEYRTASQFPYVWISLDPEFQDWEADRLLKKLAAIDASLPPDEQALSDWHHWVHADHANFAKPLDEFLEEKYQAHVAKFHAWKAAELRAANEKKDASIEKVKRYDFGDYLNYLRTTETPDEPYFGFLGWRNKSQNQAAFERAKNEAGGKETIEKVWKKEVRDKPQMNWGKAKIDAYNGHLSGKILIPQPFATLRNLYEKDSGVAISKYLLIEVFVGLVLVLLFAQFGQRISGGRPPKGKFWNLMEVFLVFIRDQIARPVLGSHDHGHAAEHADAGHHGHEAKEHGTSAHAPHDHHVDPATQFLPLLWTIFFFVLGCNLMGMVPWAGAPTAAFSVTLAMAAVTFFTVIVAGMMQFGVIGFFLNQIPGMDLPWYMAILIKPMILAIELLGLCIKHGVLAVRLLANMVAGHLVILGIMGLAFGAEAALKFSGVPGWQWGVTAVIAVVASAAFNVLELFVAFLQAYIITFLSALFIGAAIHKH